MMSRHRRYIVASIALVANPMATVCRKNLDGGFGDQAQPGGCADLVVDRPDLILLACNPRHREEIIAPVGSIGPYGPQDKMRHADPRNQL